MNKVSKEVLATYIKIKQLESRKDEVQALRPYLSSKVFKERIILLSDKIKELKDSLEQKETSKESTDVIRITIKS